MKKSFSGIFAVLSLLVLILFCPRPSVRAQAVNEHHFYSKNQGDLASLETWGTEPDGSGASPASFDLNMAVFNLVNRESATLNGDLRIGGDESLLVAGNGTSPLSFTINGNLDAEVVVENNASVTLTGSLIPRFPELKDGSTVRFSGGASSIPWLSFYNLILDNVDPVFEGEGEIVIRGSLELTGPVHMPEARGKQRYDLHFKGNADQLITGNGNIIRSYNLIIDKMAGSLGLYAGNGGTVVSADNQIIINMAPEAGFADNGNEIYAGNSVNMAGNPGSYRLTGTLILADHIEGIVNGAGNNNNFNIRDSAGSNSNATATFNNIVISAVNSGGEFRFRDGSGKRLNVKGDFIIRSGVAGRVIFYGNSLGLGGNFIIEDGFTGTIDQLNTLILEGDGPQIINTAVNFPVDNLILKNTNDPELAGEVNIAGNLHFDAGKLVTRGGGLAVLGTGAVVSGHGEQMFVDGPLGILMDNTREDRIFPLGSDNAYNPLRLTVSHGNDNIMLYVAEFFAGPPPPYDLPAGLSEVLENFYFELDIRGGPNTVSTIATMKIEQEFWGSPAGLLRIVKSEEDSWLDLGGTLENNMISSIIPFTGPGMLAVAKGKPEVLIISGAGSGGSIYPEGETRLWLPGRQSYTIKADEGYHIENLFIDGIPLANPPGYFTYSYTFINPSRNKNIHANFARNDYIDVGIFPNPARDKLHVQFRQNLEHVAVVSLITLSGVVLTEKTLSPGGNNSGFISLQGLEPGLYLVKIRYGQYILNKKVMII